MQRSLFLLILMGHCPFFTCHLYEYHYIGENKTWDEAQKYCRANYTDLATVSSMTEMERLCNSTENQGEAWIGLHSYPGRNNRTWYWSLPGVKFDGNKTNWQSGQPNDGGGAGAPENCALMLSQQWNDYPCKSNFTFVCYSAETQQSSSALHYVNTMLSWPQAQSYCRQYYTDLVSGMDQVDDPYVKSRYGIWIGLFRDAWRWSDGSTFSFRNWEYVADLVDGIFSQSCAAVLNRAGKWSSDSCTKQKPFFCYQALSLSKQVVRVKLAAEDPSVDITDPAVTESSLKQMEEMFTDKGFSVKLSWRKLPEKLNTTEAANPVVCPTIPEI